MGRILIVDELGSVRGALERPLREGGHEVFLATDGEAGKRLAAETKPDLVLVDLALADTSGIDILRTIRGDPSLGPTRILVSGTGEHAERIRAFEAGAEDYVARPFSPHELMLRVRAHLRRVTGPDIIGTNPAFGVLSIDREARRVWVRAQRVELAPVELEILIGLADTPDTVHSRARILRRLTWLDPTLSLRGINAQVKSLREKLGTAGGYIQTVRGFGYRFSMRPWRSRTASS